MIEQIFLCENAIKSLKLEVKNVEGVETGGALIGYLSDTYAVVTHCSGPGPRSQKTRTSVVIDGEYTTNYCFELSSLSKGRIYYLGDWHIHLLNYLLPSSTDIEAMENLLSSKVNIWGSLISIIFYKDLTSYRAFEFLNNRDFHEVKMVTCTDPDFLIEYL